MGGKVSKQARKLPSSNITKATSTQRNVNSPNKIHFQPSARSIEDNKLAEGTGKPTQESNLGRFHRDPGVNKNVDRIGQVKIQEIPLKLDQNNPALTTLRNKSKREAELEKGSKDNETKKTVHPSVLCGIIEDLHSTPLEKLKQNYNIDDDFLNNLGNELKIASTRIKLKDSKQKEVEGELDENRINGIGNSTQSTDVESHLEELMSPKK